MKNSSFFRFNVRDIVKGFIVAALTIILTGVSTSLSAGTLPTLAEVGHLALLGLGAGCAYLVKNIFTNSKDQFLKKEPDSIPQ